MQLETVSWADGRWSTPLPSRLDHDTTLALAFAAPDACRHPGPIDEVRVAFPSSVILGCSTAGEIDGERLRDHSIVLAVARFERTELRIADARISTRGSEAAGRSIGEQLDGPGLRAVFLLSEGHGVNGSELLRGLAAVVPARVVVTGGLAADGPRFEKTWVIRQGRLESDRACAVGLYGDAIRVTHGSRGGFDKFGPERTVTRSTANVLFELDGKPALQLYKEYLGDRAEGLPATALLFPLSVRAASDDKALVRTVLGIDERQQSMRFAGDIPEGSRAQLMRANSDRLIDASADAAKTAADASARGPTLAVAISCVGRRLVLGERTEEELEASRDALPPNATQVGYYSYGEISPHASGRCDLHNQTMTLTTFNEG